MTISESRLESLVSAFEENKINPITNDVSTDTTIENFAACELPLPSSFATLTLQIKKYKVNILQQTKNK